MCDPKDGNVSFDGQHLILRAVRRDDVWTSGRIKTLGHQSFQYGRIEASMKLPFGAGIWPAFWALGDNIMKVGWPASGEIDIMENVPEIGGLGPSRVRSTVHGPILSDAIKGVDQAGDSPPVNGRRSPGSYEVALDWTGLQVGQTATTVEVTEAAATIDTTTAQITNNYDSHMTQDLPSASSGHQSRLPDLVAAAAWAVASGP